MVIFSSCLSQHYLCFLFLTLRVLLNSAACSPQGLLAATAFGGASSSVEGLPATVLGAVGGGCNYDVRCKT